jgi:N-methylhydantoinase A/oxoprolinase/acetone carboxylase beta subunit
MYLALVGCSIFRNEIKFLESAITSEIDYYWLPQRLHNRPLELRRLMQAEIDDIDLSSNEYDAIVLLYGLCSKGTIGVYSRKHRLVVPRVQDCIAVLLGSNQRYGEHFREKPGTYWFTRGWIETGFAPGKRTRYRGVYDPYKEKYREYRKRFDREMSQFLINEWDQRWMQNYTTLAFIDWGMEGDARFRKQAEENARNMGLEFENIPGDPSLMTDLLNGNWNDDSFLIVEPGQKLLPTYHEDVFTCSGEPFTAQEETAAPGGGAGIAPAGKEERSGLGLGIDAGGTYTDAVVYDFSNERVIAWAKAPTTHDDYTRGIEECLGTLCTRLDSEVLRGVGLVSLSTTLATNAIVEGKGGRAGIILIGYDRYSLQNVHLKPRAVIRGKHTIEGELQEQLDPQEAAAAVEELLAHGIDVFALSSEVGVRNPEHEIQVKEIIRNRTNLPVVCGSELTDELNCVKRANTCFYNARLIPLVADLLSSVKNVLTSRGITAPLMVVKGDGTLMSEEVARTQPIEMVLSGPAASVIGGAYLSKISDGYVVDMGGTTTDVAIVKDGFALYKREGISIDTFRTAVKTIDVHTFGLGGDSFIRCLRKGDAVRIGPERVVPISCLAARYPKVLETLRGGRRKAGGEELLVQPVEFFLLQKERAYEDLHPQERDVLQILKKEGPLERYELAEKVHAVALSLIRTERLETYGSILRCSLTPTDLLHAAGTASFWNVEAAERAVSLYAERMNLEVPDFLDLCFSEFYRYLIYHLLSFLFGEEEGIADQHALAHNLAGHLFSRQKNFHIGLSFKKPIVFIGAPAEAYASNLQRFMDLDVKVPEFNAVANAVGAITGAIRESVTILIRPEEGRGFTAYTTREKLQFSSLDDAKKRMKKLARKLALEKAERAGADNLNVQVAVEDRRVHLSEDDEVYLETLITASVSSVPAMKQ